MKKNYPILALLFLLCTISSCSKEDDLQAEEGRATSDEIYYANQFAADLLSNVYLWNAEISNDLGQLDPDNNLDPIGTVEQIRYHENGKEIDKWTTMTDDYQSFTSSLSGVETTYGYGLTLGQFSNTGTYFFIVSYVYEDSPAEKAGMQRGDIIIGLDGEDITESNYLNALYNSQITLTMGVYTEEGITAGGTLSLNAVRMYENPILAYKTFDCGGKRVGYLAYSSFDFISVPRLIEICKEFKAEGVTELILDLRYNGGGYVITENALASMFAPESEVRNKSLYQTEVWNALYTEYFKSQGQDMNTYFSTDFEVRDENDNTISVSTADANIGLQKIYALIGAGTASASESLLVGLMPFMEVELLGGNSHGKYCSGIVFSPANLYENPPSVISNWGIYAMVNRYADRDGNNPCMPDGLQPDIAVSDYPLDGYQLGDEQETMLRAALVRAGKQDIPEARSVATPAYDLKFIPSSPLFGMRIDTRTIEWK